MCPGSFFIEDRKMEDHKDQRPYQASPTGYPRDACPEEEISLFELWRILVRQWKVVGVIAALSVLGAVAYVLLATPIYEAEAIVRPPESKYVEILNIPEISTITNADIFAKFIGNLKSSSLRQQFFAENPRFSSLLQQFADKKPQFLRDNLPKIREGTKTETGLVFLTLQGHDAKLVADWLNGFILLVEKKTTDDFVAGVEAKITNLKKEIENQLQVLRAIAGQRRLDRVVLLEEQIAIARAAKIFDRQLSGYATVESQGVEVAEDTLQRPMYMRGVKELTAEREALEKRKNDEPFIAGLRDKQELLDQLTASLQQFQAAGAIARAVSVDQPAIEDRRPVKPRRMLVLALGVVLGGCIGVFAAFAVNFVQEQKAKNKG
jgi:chain length determinant protein (polysaccharide antigen chain regulator)